MPATHQLKRRTTSRRSKTEPSSHLAASLGASRSFGITSKPHGPFGVAALLDEIQNRLVSRGGRPSDPGATIRRLVPIRKQVWRSLKAQAAFLSSHGKRVSPAQLAAMLVEKSVFELQTGRKTNPEERGQSAR
ncbi:MAG: hypothetical protein ACHP78_18215 [Terriglobales bacterium]